MPCGLGLSFFPNQYKSPTGLERAGCPIRLKELNNASKVSPTKLQGAQVARENYIRRRVATIVQVKKCLPEKKRFKGEECNTTYAYGPVFGIARGPKYGGRNGKGCKGGGCLNVYYANGGSGSDVTKWKRLYGGPRVLFNTSNCLYGCCGKVGPKGLGKGCYCYALKVSSDVPMRRGDALWPADNFANTPPIDLFDAVVLDSAGSALYVRCKNKNSYMSKIFASDSAPNAVSDLTVPKLAVYRKDNLNNWSRVGFITKYGRYAEGTGHSKGKTGFC